MEKVIITLQRADSDEAWCTRMRTEVVADLLELGLPGLAVNVRDDVVRNSLMTLTTLDPPVVGFVTVWAHQSYGEAVTAALARLTIRGGSRGRVSGHRIGAAAAAGDG